jgi:hypothetical protein
LRVIDVRLQNVARRVEIDKAGWAQARGVCLKDPDDARFGPADLLTHFPRLCMLCDRRCQVWWTKHLN